jgi:membrane-associated phospholipid phosphatase
MLLLNIISTLTDVDRWLLKKINGEWTNGFFDHIFLLFRLSWFWFPLYLFLFLVAVFNFKKNWWWWIILFVCTVALTDMTGTRLFKHLIPRYRPCSDPDFFSNVRMLLENCAGGNSFISNHAANHFGMATFVFFTLRHYFNKYFYFIWLWPILVCYAQLYVGVHYPSDIIAGAIIGMLLGFLTASIFNKRFASSVQLN